MNRAALPAAFDAGVVAVLRASSASQYHAVCAQLVAAGVRALELTLTTPGTIELLPELRASLPSASFGVGTVVNAQQARSAIAAGAEFLVTPGTFSDVASAAADVGVPFAMGALSPTEVKSAWEWGASAVKIFPAATVGADYLTQLRGPFPDLLAMPSGGVGIDAIDGWIRAGAAAVSLGGPLIGKAFDRADDELASRAQRALAAVQIARGR